MTGQEILALVMERRTNRGLKLEFNIPDRSDVFVCYAKDETQKAAWLASAKRNGWKLACNNS